MARKTPLSPRETEILRLVCYEKTSEEIASELGISQMTVNVHRASIRTRLGITTTVGLVKYAIRQGLVKV